MSNQSINNNKSYSTIVSTTTSSSPSVVIRKPNEGEEDTFKIDYRGLMKRAFSQIRPSLEEMDSCFPLIQQIYYEHPDHFQVISSLHQNRPEDRLHFSVELRERFYTYKFHINGYLINLGFNPSDITYQLHYSNQWIPSSEPKLLVRFVAKKEMEQENRE